MHLMASKKRDSKQQGVNINLHRITLRSDIVSGMCKGAQNSHVYFQPQPVIRTPVSTLHLDPICNASGKAFSISSQHQGFAEQLTMPHPYEKRYRCRVLAQRC
ncbi:hypothetical protein AVEN_26060-1 [Araneus ventricosus]|uniref:Uncharacterized protein n=1 Tax=Araneus ventricosus TaxID=182803 RepID=A0A4Y2U1V9_ARAVE|nr:hypothetical protein AVEN_26060-1 [Araneus ventricosus]